MNDFSPAEHPRADAGRFTDKPQSSPELAPLTAEIDTQLLRDEALEANTSTERIGELVDIDNWMVDAWVARHPNLSASDQAVLFERGDFQVRSRLAGNAAATSATISRAAKDGTRDVRAIAARHPELSDEDQLLLAGDIRQLVQASVIQAAIAGVRDVTPAARAVLAVSPDPWIREQLAGLEASISAASEATS